MGPHRRRSAMPPALTSSGPAHPLIESDHVEGTAVYDVNGKQIGAIKRLVIEKVIPTRTERHALAQSRRPMGMTRYSLRSGNPGMGQPSRGLVLAGTWPMRSPRSAAF